MGLLEKKESLLDPPSSHSAFVTKFEQIRSQSAFEWSEAFSFVAALRLKTFLPHTVAS